MSVSTVVTRGFGAGAIAYVVTRGYGSYSTVPTFTPPPFWRPGFKESADVLMGITETRDVLMGITESADVLPGTTDDQVQ